MSAKIPSAEKPSMSRNVLITGISSGIGAALAQACLERGDRVYGLSRREPPAALAQDRFHFLSLDLSRFDEVPAGLGELLGEERRIDLAVLNAGVLGEIKDLRDTGLEELHRVMEVNTWANKILLDALFARDLEVRQVIGISSGAAVSGSRGWSAYALSKACFKMLLQLYAAERPTTHFCSFAPGLIDTAMQDYLCALPAEDCETYPSLPTIQAARGTESMPTPEQVAPTLLEAFEKVRAEPSGCFVDLRTMAG